MQDRVLVQTTCETDVLAHDILEIDEIISKNRFRFLVDQPHTPIQLIDEINDKISKVLYKSNPLRQDSPIAVFYSVEWAINLALRGCTNVTVITEEFDESIQKLLTKFGINYIITDEAIDMKFDVIVGNPPYQNGQTDAGNFALWPLFVTKSYDLVTDNGIIALVTPQTWAANSAAPSDRSQSSSLVRRDVLSRGHLSVVNFNISNHFKGVGSTFSYFVFTKNKKPGLTEVITDNGTYRIKYPDEKWLKTRLVTTKSIKRPSLKLVNNGKETPGFRRGGKNITDNGSYPIANTSAQYSRGEYLMSSVQHPHQTLKKVIFSDSGFAKPFYDDGKLGLGHHARAFEVESEEEAQQVIDYLNSEYLVDVASTIPNSGSMSHLSKLLSVGFFD